ncbi:MAG: protein-glutamate O-methyltransferase family protein [Anaerolineae bacterium]|nr:protein-glutamate O-methyltransferase family protein [Anaerolineae bacterium]
MTERIRPRPIRTDGSDAFAHDTMRRRLPGIIRDTLEMNPDYPDDIRAALDRLRADLAANAPIPHIDDPVWGALYARHEGETWLDTEWFFAETYCYRLIIEAVRWEQTGRDPFAPHKLREIKSDALRDALHRALGAPGDERLAGALLRSLWGNRIDLSYKVAAAHGSAGETDDLLVDERHAAVDYLFSREPGEVHLVLDNAGTELATDFVLADTLLDGAAERVILHVKRHPTFVSDATYDDVLILLAEMTGRGDFTKGFGDPAREIGARLQSALLDGRLLVEPDIFWNSGWFLWEMPPRFESFFEQAALVIFKGDANYRRIVGDALWQPETPFTQVTDYFPAPLLALRSLKSDPIIGLPPGMAARLDAEDALWRVNGRRGVAQFAGR